MIVLDFNKPSQTVGTDLVFVENDSLNTLLEFTLKRGDTPINLTTEAVEARIRFKTSSGFVGDEPCEPVSDVDGTVKYEMLGGQLVRGEVLGIVSIYKGGERQSSCKFSFSVVSDLSSNKSVQDSKQYSELQKALADVNTAITTLNDILAEIPSSEELAEFETLIGEADVAVQACNDALAIMPSEETIDNFEILIGQAEVLAANTQAIYPYEGTFENNKIYYATLSANTAFTMPEVVAGRQSQIMLYMSITADITIDWGLNRLYLFGKVPVFAVGKNYRVIFEYDPIVAKWCIGAIESAVSA